MSFPLGQEFRTPLVDANGQITAPWQKRFSQAIVLDLSDALGIVRGINFANDFAGAQAAIDDFGGLGGLVVIPHDYTGPDYTSTGPNVVVLDLRIRQMVNTGQYGILQYRQIIDSAPTTASGNQTMLNPEMVVTAGTNANELTSVLPAAYRSAGSAHIWALNPYVKFDNLSGKGIGSEIDVVNGSGVDVTSANASDFVGQYIITGGGKAAGIGLAIQGDGNAGSGWVIGAQIQSWIIGGAGLDIEGPSQHILMVPDADDSLAQIGGLNAAKTVNTWYVTNEGNANFTGIFNLSTGAEYITTTTSQPPFQTLTDAATVVWDFANYQSRGAYLLIGGNRTLQIDNCNDGASGTLIVEQDATGGRTLALPAGSKVIGGGGGVVTLTATAGASDILSFENRGGTLYWNYGLNYT
jgi:hypothetical protein